MKNPRVKPWCLRVESPCIRDTRAVLLMIWVWLWPIWWSSSWDICYFVFMLYPLYSSINRSPLKEYSLNQSIDSSIFEKPPNSMFHLFMVKVWLVLVIKWWQLVYLFVVSVGWSTWPLFFSDYFPAFFFFFFEQFSNKTF